MIIKKVILKNIKSYGEDSIELEEGITSIHGLNGAGKSTVLESIGYVLFDSLPYNQAEFVRKGEKTGEVSVIIRGTDDIDYTITRKCGSSQSYSLRDNNGILMEGKEDVGGKLCEILGYKVPDISQLRSLFENAVGVLQGTFVSEFLESPSRRKAIFDPLLRIDEYNTAHKNLLQLKNYIKGSIDEMDNKISYLQGKTERLEPLKSEKGSIIQHKSMLLNDMAAKKELLDKAAREKEVYDAIENAVRELENKQKILVTNVNNDRTNVERVKTELRKCEEAKKKLEQNEASHRQYLEKTSEKEELEKQRVKRDALLSQANVIGSDIRLLKNKISDCVQNLQDLKNAEAEIKMLEPIALEQEKLESDIQGIASELGSLNHELAGLNEKIKPLKGTKGNACPLMPGIECKSITDFKGYFDSQSLKLGEQKVKLEARKKEAEEKLKGLNDPKLRLNVKKESLKKQGDLKIQHEELLDKLCEEEGEQNKLVGSLSALLSLESQFKAVNDKLHMLKPAYDEYQQNIKIAGLIEERHREHDKAINEHEKKSKELANIQKQLEDTKIKYNAESHSKAKLSCEKLSAEAASINARLESDTCRLESIDKELASIGECLRDMAMLRENREAEVNYLAFVERAREIIRMAGPEVIRVFIELISKEATEMYCEIAGDRRFEIKWTQDYDIQLMEDGRERTFRQLSGGEQMSAALAVRLAVLKILTNSDVVFLDEPTQNLDESRREHLAQEIMRIRDFKQMVIISHDDTFNASLENVIEVEKVNGESKVRRRPGYARPQATLQ